MSKYIIVAETGADIPAEIVNKYGIKIVPMHVSFGTETKDDMTFPVSDIFDYYHKTGTLPKTAGSTPGDFEIVFDEIHEQYPDKHILHLAYSAITTCSYQSAVIAADGLDYITSIDTKCVSAGQAFLVLTVAEWLEKNPDAPLDVVIEMVNDLINRIHMGFIPGDLVYLKAGGRVSNAAYMGAKILNLSPVIEIVDGKLMSAKKYRGSIMTSGIKLIKEFSETHHLMKDRAIFVYSGDMNPALKEKAENTAKECGFESCMWIQAGCVVSTHSGPGAFGIIGFSEK
ncbi:MAG: DegV family protein [Anaerorhabdus sp.]|uniref:DegV family protein n=1 Tax=Anaerorhabdus sp. TaxID=1872524 RepID=UPI002FCB7E69